MDFNFMGTFSDDVRNLFLLIAICLCVIFVLKRQFMAFIGFFVLASLIGFVIYQPEVLEIFGEKLYNAVVGG